MINTHLHVDHVGWNTRLQGQSWVPTFRNASPLMPRAGFEFWNPADNPKIAGGVNLNVFEDSVAPVYAAGQVGGRRPARSVPEASITTLDPGVWPGAACRRRFASSRRLVSQMSDGRSIPQGLHP